MAKRLVEASTLSHMGCVRKNNEDSFFFNGALMALQAMDQGAQIHHSFTEKTQVYAVCDGMGGAQYGERASYLTARRLIPFMMKARSQAIPDLIAGYVMDTSREVRSDALRHGARASGSTLALLVIKADMLYVANTGDSRVYLLRDGRLTRLSDDHSEVNLMVKAGLLTPEQARKHRRSNVITRYIGMPEADSAEELVHQTELKAHLKDRLLLVSDGISDLISDRDIHRFMSAAPKVSDLVRALAMEALEMGGRDNLTCIALDLVQGFNQALSARA